MPEVKVELVKYDTKKTKKRKRANFTVSAKTEAAVIEKLEKIHKGDQVESINELVWGEEIVKTQAKENGTRPISGGIVKFYDDEKGFGFINADNSEEDLFFHATALNGVNIQDNDLVEFEMSEGPKGPIAIRIKLIEQ